MELKNINADKNNIIFNKEHYMTNKISNRTFGVELETIGLTMEEVYKLFTEKKIPITNSYKTSRTHWRVCYDQSINNYDKCNAVAEIVSPILSGNKGIREVEKVCRMLKKAGVKTNTSCGLHVHVGVKDLHNNEIISVLQRYRKYEKHIDKFVYHGRRKNNSEFCNSIPNISNVQNVTLKDYMERIESYNRSLELVQTDIQYYKNLLGKCTDNYYKNVYTRYITTFKHDCKMYKNKILKFKRRIEKIKRQEITFSEFQNLFYGRYYKINVLSYNEIGTLEFRQHNGTIESKTVTNWIKFVLNFVEQSRRCANVDICYKNETKNRYKVLYTAFKNAPKRGLSKERISHILNINLRSVPRVVKNIKKYYKGSVELYNGRFIFIEVSSAKKDSGPLMGLPANSKTFFIERSTNRSRKFSSWI